MIKTKFDLFWFQFEQEQPKSLESMMIDIQRRQNEFEHEQISTVNSSLMIFLFFFEYLIQNDQDHSVSDMGDGQEKSRKTFYREFKKV